MILNIFLNTCLNVRQDFEDKKWYLERLYKRPQENANGVALSEKFDQTGGSKKSQKADVDEVLLRGRAKVQYG